MRGGKRTGGFGGERDGIWQARGRKLSSCEGSSWDGREQGGGYGNGGKEARKLGARGHWLKERSTITSDSLYVVDQSRC